MKQSSLPFLKRDASLGSENVASPQLDVVDGETSGELSALKPDSFSNLRHKADSRKSESAYRTIGEVVALLDVPAHVLRFWEDKFSILNPLKRNGGRRYYKPEDIEKLLKIKDLLYQQGYTIKGVQQIFKAKDKTKLQKVNAELNVETHAFKEELILMLEEINVARDYIRRGIS